MKSAFKLFLFFVFIPWGVSAQYFDAGQDPSSVKWDQIKNDNFQIIFPERFNLEAQRLANSLDLVYEHASKTLEHQPKRISVVLHNYSSLGNAFVAWAPKRAEFYTMTPQDIYPQDWLNQLAIHEYRHVVQIDKMNQGFTKILYFLLGEQAPAGVFGLFVPFWFTEGDAVAAETGLSLSGRGRLPGFEMEIRTQVIGQKIYSYEKAVFRSYKDFVPDRYHLGYYLVANGRKRYGHEMWAKTLTHVARHPFTPTPFSRGIKKGSGMNKWKFYKSTMYELDSLWRIQQSQISYSNFRKINQEKKKVYTNYRYPQYLSDSSILCQKFGLGDIEALVELRSDGTERKIHTQGFANTIWLSAKNNSVVWSEYGFDKRWENRLYSDVLLYDLKTGKRKRLSRKHYYFSPALSPDASKIAVVESTPENNYSLVILESSSGKELQKIHHPGSAFLISPIWSDDGKWLVVILMTSQGKALATVHLETGTIDTVSEFSFKDITHPVARGEYIFYHGTYSGIDNIYALHIPTGSIFQVTSSRYGAFDPALSPDGSKISYSDYTSTGFDIVEIPFQPGEWKPLEEVKDHSIKLYETLTVQEGGALDFDSLPQKVFEVKRYIKFPHLLNIHSWSPVYANADNINTTDLHFTLLSQNKLSTLTAIAGYLYNYHEQVGSVTTEISYKAWYPVFTFSSSHGGRASYSFDEGKYYNWKENSVRFGISQPLNLTKGKYSSYIIPEVSVSARHISDPENAPVDFLEGRMFNMRYDLEAYRLLKRSARDMRSRWGQAFSMHYRHAPAGDFSVKSLLSTQFELYFPGIGKHHSLQLTLADQRQGKGTYNFVSPISFIRGYYLIGNHDRFNKVAVDYKLPLLYPDLRVGPFIYLQRIKANLFYDYGLGMNSSVDFTYYSLGTELTSDLHLLNFIAPFELGVRYIYLPANSASSLEFLFNINFSDL